MPEGQQRRCRCGGSTGAAHTPAANVKPRGQIPMPRGTSVEGGALARASRPPQPPPNHSLELQVWLVDPTASPAVPEALGHSVRLQKKSICLCRLTEQKPLLTPQMLFTREQHSSCVCPLSFHPAQEEFSNASHLFPHQQEPIQSVRHQQHSQKCQAKTFPYPPLLPANKQFCIIALGKSILRVPTFLPVQIFGL